LNRAHALLLLSECTGDDIWPVHHCRVRNVPESWIDELLDAYESGFDSPRSTIYYRGDVVNQFEGICDVHLACKLGHYLGVDVQSIIASVSSRSRVVRAIREAVEES
jgi:hypothetical protein